MDVCTDIVLARLILNGMQNLEDVYIYGGAHDRLMMSIVHLF